MKRIGLAILFFVLLILPIYIRSIIEAKNNLELGDLLVDKGKFIEAVEHYRTAIQWNSPFNQFGLRAAEKLYALSKNVKVKDEKRAIILNELIRGIGSMKSWQIFSAKFVVFSNNSRQDLITIDPNYRSFPKGPKINSIFKFLSFTFFVVWILVTIIGIFRGITKDGSFNLTQLKVWIPSSFLAYLLWLGMLSMA